MYEITDKNRFIIPYIVKALQKVLNTEPTDEENSVFPLKVVQNFYMEHPHLL